MWGGGACIALGRRGGSCPMTGLHLRCCVESGLPFDQALEKMASLLRPGGVLAVLGLFRETGLTDTAVALVAVPVNVFYALSRGRSYSGAPTRPPDMSLRDIRETISSNLPDARLRRLLLWRYLLTWQKPQEQAVT